MTGGNDRKKVFRRLTLRDGEGRVFLDRWGVRVHWLGSVFIHKMSAPDPGNELHDHPWAFVTIPLWGGYVERRADAEHAREDHCYITFNRTVRQEVRRPLIPRRMKLSEAHTIDRLRRKHAWTLVIAGRVKREWGFYTRSSGWVHHIDYEQSPEGMSRAVDWSSNYKAGGQSLAMKQEG